MQTPSNREVENKGFNDGKNSFDKENDYQHDDIRYRIYEEAYKEGKKHGSRSIDETAHYRCLE